MAFNKGFSGRNVDSISGSNGQVLTKVSGIWVAATPTGGGGGGGISEITLDPALPELNLVGKGTVAEPLYLRMNPVFTSVTASFNGNGSQVTNLTASNVNNFTADVRAQLSAGSNMQYSGGAFALSANPSVTSVTASAGFSGSQATVAEVNTDFIDFAATSNAAVPHSAGRLSYNSDLENLQFDLPNDATTLNIGKQLLLKVTNNTAATIAKGKVVKINGSAGSSDTMYVVTASWENDAGSADTIGFLASELAAGETGYAVLSGMLYGVNTNAYSAGQMIYLSSSGDFTTTEPTPPNHTVRLGNISRVQNNNGSIFVRIQNGYEINELHDVLISSPQNYDLLVRDTDGLWKNTKTLAGNYTFSGTNTFNGAVTGSNAYFANNIRVNGTASIALLETINQTSLQVGEKYIILMSGSTDHVGLDGSGLLWGSGSVSDPTQGPEGENAYIKYRADNDQLEVFPGLRVSGSLTSSLGFSGSGAGLTNIPASAVDLSAYSTTTTNDSTYAKKDSTNTFTAVQTFSSAVTASAGISGSTFYGDGSQLTGIAAGVNTAQSYTWSAQQNFAAGAYFGTGSIRVPYVAKTQSYNPTTTDYIVSYSGSNLTGSLPDASNVGVGTMIVVKNLHTSSLIISASAGDLIDGGSTVTIYGQYSSYAFVSDGGTNWFIV